MKFLIPGNYSDNKSIFEKLHFTREHQFHDIPFAAAMLSLSEWASSPININATEGQSAELFCDVDIMVMSFSISEAELEAMANALSMEKIPDEQFKESVYHEMTHSLRPTTPWFDAWEADWDDGKVIAWGSGWNKRGERSFELMFVAADAGGGRVRVFMEFHERSRRNAKWENGYFRQVSNARPAGSP